MVKFLKLFFLWDGCVSVVAPYLKYANWIYIIYMSIVFLRMKKITVLFITSIILGQYDYSLEDINPTSEYYGNNVGTSFFEGNITLHYFGHFT